MKIITNKCIWKLAGTKQDFYLMMTLDRQKQAD